MTSPASSHHPPPVAESRDAFMHRVRTALGRPNPAQPLTTPSPPPIPEGLIRLNRTTDRADLTRAFTTRAQAAGMKVHPTTPAQLDATIAAILADTALTHRRAGLSIADESFAQHIRKHLAQASIEAIAPSATLDPLYDTDLGFTDVVAAIAETGTLVIHSSPAHSRGAFLVPPVHVAVLHTRQILPDLMDLWQSPHLRPLAPLPTPPASIVLITGPSKTADIEGILITGVHGPREVHIVLIDD